MSKSVFFSWGKDRELKDVFVKALKNYLGGEDTVWESDSDCAGEITAACERAIKNATVFVVLLSDRAMKTSEWIRWEIGLAQEHYGESDYARYIVPIFWSGDFEEKEPFRTLRKSVSGIDNLKGAEMPDEGVLEALCKKVCRAINEHGVENYYASDLFSKESMLDLVQENSEDVRDGRCNFDEIWTERTVRELDEYGRVKSEGDEEEEIGGEQLLQDGPSLLIGEGGSGKSWLMRKTIYALLQERAEKLIFEVKFRDFSDWQAQTSDRNKLEAYLFERFCANAHVFGYTKLNFSALLSESELYLLIDGLDEVVWDKQKTEALQAIGHFLEKYPKAKKHTLYTSRNYSDRNRVGANKVYRLLPLDERQRGELIDHLFVYLRKEGEQDGFVLALSHINEEIRANPFFLTQLAKIYAAEGILPQHYSEIYEKSVNQFLSRERGSSIPMGLRDRLPKAAYYKYTADNVGRNMKFEHAYLAACDRSEETANRDLRFLKERSIIRNDNFVYQVFMDFYVAKYILTLACEQDEYGDAVLREKAIEKLKESLGRTENWDNITKIVLSMVETHYAELFGEIFGLLCGSGRYELLLDTARDILLGEGIRKISREVAAKELLVRTMKGEYAPYGEQFCYVPQYELYGETAKAVTEHAGKKELSLLRDVCFVYAAANTIEEAEGVTEEMSAQLREACAAQYPEGNTQRGMLCRLFYGLERASAAELSKRFVAVYPREFCVLHAANRMSGEHVSAHKAKRFEDEEGLFDADRAGEPIGLVAFSYDLNQLPKRDYGRVTGLILLPTEKRKLLPIGEAMPRLLYYSMPDNIQSVGKYAINFCPKLREVSMASGIKKFEANWCVTGRNLRLDYVCCKSLSEKTSALYIPKFVERVRLPKGLREIGWFAFEGCTSLQKIVLPEGLREIEGCAFEGCTSLQSIVLPKGLKRIGGFAFEGCTSLQKIVLPEGLREIGWNAFEGCTSLQKIVLPEGLREIGVQAFKGCTSLQRIVLPEGLQEIWWYAFEDCASLREIVLPKGLQVIQDNAFKGCTSLREIVLPKGLQVIQDNAFKGCTSMQTIDLPEGLQKIGERAFEGCTSLREIVLPKGLKRIEAYAFA